MAVLFDYLDWRGDLSFQTDPPNEADCYLIAKIGCPDLSGIVPPDEREVTLQEAVSAYRTKEGPDPSPLGAAASPLILESFYRLPAVPRFQPLMLSGFRRTNDPENTEQFSALTVRIPGGLHFVTFRGTDDTLIAWKENFHMSVMDRVPAQEDALRYLRWAMDAYDGRFIVCGHSKGGNLAVYASAMVPHKMQERIVSIYDFDGPGFQEDFLKEEGFQRILPKLHFLIPQNSIVGLLLSAGKEPEITACSYFGPKAHDGFKWEVRGTRFVRAEGLSRSSALFRNAVSETLAGMSAEQREAFVEGFFRTMTSTGAFTLTDLTEAGLLNALEIAKSLGRDREVQRFALSFISNTLADIRGKKAVP